VSLTAGKSVIDGRTWMNLAFESFAHSIKVGQVFGQSSITAAIQPAILRLEACEDGWRL